MTQPTSITTPPQQQALLLRGERCRYRVGHDHTHNGQRIHVTSAISITLGDLTTQDAKQLGYRGAAALVTFKRAWITKHDSRWLEATERTDAEILRRFTEHWPHQSLWLVRYTPAEAPRFMAHPVPGRSGDYVTNQARSIDPDAECIDSATQDQYAKAARPKSLATRQTFQADLERERAIRKGERRPYPSSEQRAA